MRMRVHAWSICIWTRVQLTLHEDNHTVTNTTGGSGCGSIRGLARFEAGGKYSYDIFIVDWPSQGCPCIVGVSELCMFPLPNISPV